MKVEALPIITEHLILRQFTLADVDDVFAYQRLPEVARYLYRPPRTRERCVEVLTKVSAPVNWAQDGDELVLAICRRDESDVVGEVVLRYASAYAQQAEIGWVLNPEYEGRGYATEAARALAVFAFDVLAAHRLFARLDVLNTGSVKLCERLGMRREAHLIENDVDVDGKRRGSEYIYAALENDLIRA